MTADKRVKIAGLVSAAVILFQAVDVFFLHSQIQLTSTNIISRLVSLVIIIFLSRFLGFNLKRFCFKSYGWYFEIIYGLIFSVIPAALIYLFKYVYFYYRGYDNLELTFNPSGFDQSIPEKVFLVSLLFYIFSLLLISCFKEIFYRGYLITQLTGKFGVSRSIVFQAVIYTLSFVPTIIFYLINGRFDFQGPLMTVFLIVSHLFLNFISGIKWGLFYKVNGTIWMSVTDHLVNNFIVTSFYFTEHRLPEKWYVIEVIVIQLLSFAMFIPFYLRRDKLNEQVAAEFALSQEAMKMKVDNYTPNIIRKRVDNTSKQKVQFEEVVLKFEEPVSLREVTMPSEEDLALSVRGYSIDDSGFEYNSEVDPHDSHPSQKSQQYFDDLIGRDAAESEKEKQDNKDNSNVNNISGLVQDYFNKNFDKHTFG